MSTEFIFTKEMKSREVHIGICENMSRILYGSSEETEAEEKDQFALGYQTALKEGTDKLAVYVIEQGKPLMDSDPNSSLLSY